MGRQLDAEFADLKRRLLADPEIVVPPSAEMLEAWRRAFAFSGGRLSIRWSPSGTPAHIRGMDAGPLLGEPEQIALAFLAKFGPDLRELLGLSPADSFDAPSVATMGDGSFATVTFGHRLASQPKPPESGAPSAQTPESFPVQGDWLALHIRLVGMPQGTGRVVLVTASWNRIINPPQVIIPAKNAGAAAVAAVGVPGGIVGRIEPVAIVVPEAGVERAQYTVWVHADGGPMVVFVDAATGAVLEVRQGWQANRLVHRYHPYSLADELPESDYASFLAAHNDPAQCAGLPLGTVCEASTGAHCTYTAPDGSFDPSATAWPAAAQLSGRYYHWHDHPEGAYFGPFDQFLPDPATTLTVLATGPIATGGARLDRPSKDMIDGMVYTHLTYQRALLGLAGLDVDGWPRVNYQVWWEPLGYTCSSDSQCQRCANSRTCQADRFWDMNNFDGCDESVDPADCGTSPNFCDLTVGACDWSGFGASVTMPEGCANGDLIEETFDAIGECIGFHPEFFWREAGWTGGPNAFTAWDELETRLDDTVAHENTHTFQDFSGFDDRVGYAGERGQLSGFMSEAVPEAAGAAFYTDTAFFDATRQRTSDGGAQTRGSADRATTLAKRFWGDPVGGANRCGGVEWDVPGDDFNCPQNALTCRLDKCILPHDFDPTTPDVVDPSATCDVWRSDWPSEKFCTGPTGEGTGNYGFQAASRYENNTWLRGIWLRMAAIGGRGYAADAFGAFLADTMDTASVVARGWNSLYRRMAWPTGRSAATWSVGMRSYLAYRAVNEVTYPFDGTVGPTELFDTAPSTWWLGELLPESADAWRVGEMEWADNLLSEDDWNNHAFYAYEGKDYQVELASLTGASLFLVRGVPPSEDDPEGTAARTIVVLGVSGGTGVARIRAERSGPIYLGVGRHDFTGTIDNYSLTIRMVDDDYPDTDVEAITLPPFSAGAVPVGQVAGGDADAFRFPVVAAPVVVTVRAVGDLSPDRYLAYAEFHRVSGATEFCRFGRASTPFCQFETGPGSPSSPTWYFLRVVGLSSGTAYHVSITPPRLSLPFAPPHTLPCDEAVSAPAPGTRLICDPVAGSWWPEGGGPALSGVLRSATETDQLWFHATEGTAYAMRLWLPGGFMSLHSPRVGGTATPDDQHLLLLRDESPAGTFVAPVTGWYRLRVSRPEGGGLYDGGYPAPYAVRVMRSPGPVDRYPEIHDWTGQADGMCGSP